jgi:uncharacterized protein (TIGR00369 family)
MGIERHVADQALPLDMKKIDQVLARQAFDHALDHHDQVFGEFFLAKLLGFEISYPPEACRVEFPVQDFMFNPQGSVHGGIIALAMDVSMGHLLNRLQGPGATLEMKVQYLRPLRAGRAVATGSVLRRGGSIAFLESRLTDLNGELAAMATATWKTMTPAQRPAGPTAT